MGVFRHDIQKQVPINTQPVQNIKCELISEICTSCVNFIQEHLNLFREFLSRAREKCTTILKEGGVFKFIATTRKE